MRVLLLNTLLYLQNHGEIIFTHHFEHPYEIDPKYGKSVAYFSMEYAIDNSFKIYSGGLGYLSGSHMRSAHDLRQNLVGVGILWSYGYYNQIRAEDGSMATQYMRKNYPFLEDHNIKFLIHVCGAPVWVKAYFLNPETFGTAPMFFLSTDLEENDEESRNISRRLYDANGFTRIAQYVLLGKGGARLFDELGIEPEIYHLNEAHGLAAAFHVLAKTGSVEEVRKRFVFTTHTPEEAGNEKMDVNTMNTFSFFDGLSMEQVRAAVGMTDNTFNYTLAALRLSHIANGVSKLHGEVSRQMWKDYEGICPIIHITNAQNQKYWQDPELAEAFQARNKEAFIRRKRALKKLSSAWWVNKRAASLTRTASPSYGLAVLRPTSVRTWSPATPRCSNACSSAPTIRCSSSGPANPTRWIMALLKSSTA